MDPPLTLMQSPSHVTVLPFLPPSSSQRLTLSCHLFSCCILTTSEVHISEASKFYKQQRVGKKKKRKLGGGGGGQN